MPSPQADQLEPALHLMRLLWGLDHSLMVASKHMELKLGITERQRQILAFVGAQPGISAARLSELLKLHPTTIAGVIFRLRRRRLVSVTVDPADRRRLLLRLTEAGKKASTVDSVETAVARALASLPEEGLRGMRTLVEAIVEELDRPGAFERSAAIPSPSDPRTRIGPAVAGAV